MARSESINVVIAGGGTGGHLYPGIALAQEFQKRRPTEIMFIGTSYGIENQILPKTPYRFQKIWMRGLQRKVTPGNLLFPLRLLVSLVQCAYFLLRFRAQVVIGTGGYVSGPALMAAIVLRIPTVIQEQNSYPGLVNRLLGKWVKQVHVTYEDSLPYFRKQSNTFVTGNPIRSEFTQKNQKVARPSFNLQKDKMTLFIFGGSQGAHAINQVVLNCVERLLAFKDLQLLWATGHSDYERVKTQCEPFKENVSVHSFIEDMSAAYAAADFVLCRAGATTLSEITTWGLPAILVPYPYAAAGHQEFNAKTVEKAGAALMISHCALNEDRLLRNIAELIAAPEKRRLMSRAAKKLAKPNAAAEMVDKIEALLFK